MSKVFSEIGRSSSILESARLPLAALEGESQCVCYVNPAFCQLVGKTSAEIIGRPFAQLVPPADECLLQVGRVLSSGKAESHAEQKHAKPHPLYWSYDIWPVWAEERDRASPVGVILLVTETAPFHQRASVMNEALLVSAVRQHELIEEAESLRTKLEQEIQERRRAEAAIEQVAFYDPLTDLANRRLLMDRLYKASLGCSRSLHHGAILFIDLDHFKTLNDTQGHHVGDLLLQQVAKRLLAGVRDCDTVGRLGGDEFVVLILELSEDAVEADHQSQMIGAKLLKSLNEPYLLSDQEYHTSGSIGITLFGEKQESVVDLMKRADLALYRSKAAGGNTVRFFEAEMQVAVVERAVLDTELRQALQQGQFVLHFQPQVDVNGDLVGAETLLRWTHPTHGLLLPAEFLDFAEENGLIVPIGNWVARAACQQIVDWGRRPETAHLTLSMNVSYREFSRPTFAKHLLTVLDEAGANPQNLVLEVTERVISGLSEEGVAKLLELKARGIRIALDDFGMGFSSLAGLKSLPLDQLKIAQSLVREMPTDRNAAVIASAIVALGQGLGWTIVAEGVESSEQWHTAASMGCEVYQGFLFGRPGVGENLRRRKEHTEKPPPF